MNKWQSLDIREQGFLLIATAIVLVLVLWFGIVSPMQHAVENQRMTNRSYTVSLSNVRQLSAELKQLQTSGKQAVEAGTNLTQLVDSSLRRNSLKMSGFQPGSDGSVSLRFDDVALDSLLQWLYEMENGQGVKLSELSVRKGSKTGYVAATVRLQNT